MSYTGGIEVYGTNINLTINNYVIGFNYKPLYHGGGLLIVGGANTYVSINNSRICNNRALMGGAIAMYNGNLSVTNCILDNNTAVTPYYDGTISQYETTYGGAFFISAGTATFTGCTFSANNGGNNHPSVPGGGTNGTYLRGGAIAARYNGTTGAFSSNKNISLTVDNCKFINNQSNANGIDIYGAVYQGTCTINVTRSLFNTTSNYNVVASSTPSISINTSGTVVTRNGTGINYTAAASTYNANPTPPNFSGSCGSITLLPVEFLDFSGACQLGLNALHWSTATEHNNAYFTIERAGNDGLFSELATIQGSQTTTELTNYDFQDAMPLRGLNYYRLSQTDMNGDAQILKTISVDNNKCLEDGNGMFVFADQSGQYITIDYPFQSHRTMNIEIYNSIGQLIETQSLQFESAVSRTQIHLRSSFSNGMYFLKLSDSSEAFTEKFMIRKQ